jgi:hypothetical protein
MARRKRSPRTNDDGSYLIGTVMGISVGAIFCLSGFVIVILGFTGSIEWIVKGANFSSKITNAGPGVFFALLGAIILWRYKPRTFTHQMRDDRLGRSWDIGIREMKRMPYEAEHMREMMKMFDSKGPESNPLVITDSSPTSDTQSSDVKSTSEGERSDTSNPKN